MLRKLTCYFSIALLSIRQDIVCKNIVCIFCTVALLNIRQNVLCKVVSEIAKQLMVCSNLNLSETGNKKGVIHINPCIIYWLRTRLSRSMLFMGMDNVGCFQIYIKPRNWVCQVNTNVLNTHYVPLALKIQKHR